MSFVLSVDVGKRNLALCEMNAEGVIQSWRNLDLACSGEESGNRGICEQADCPTKATHRLGLTFLCRKHLRGRAEPCTSTGAKDLAPAALKKMTKPQLVAVASKYDVQLAPLKKDLLGNLLTYVREECFTPLSAQACLAPSSAEPTLAHDARTMYTTLRQFYQRPFDYVIIENQLGHIATKNMELQAMLCVCFAALSPSAEIRFVNATNKLRAEVGKKRARTEGEEKGEKGEKGEKAKPLSAAQRKKQRKKDAVSACLDRLPTGNSAWLDHFAQSSKKDDLADSYLQGVWFLSMR